MLLCYITRKKLIQIDEATDRIRDHLVSPSSGFSKYFPEVLSDKYRWMTDPFHVNSLPDYEFSLEEGGNCIDIISNTSLRSIS